MDQKGPTMELRPVADVIGLRRRYERRDFGSLKLFWLCIVRDFSSII